MSSYLPGDAFPILQAFAVSLGIGLLMGLERERARSSKAGLRTFALVGLLGCLGGLLAERTGNPWLLGIGWLLVGVMMIAAFVSAPPDDGDPGTTSVVAVLMCYGLGALVWYGQADLAVMLAVASTALLYFKTELHGISRNLSPTDLLSILQFSVLSLVILPILPDRNFGPYAALNPHQIWLMVVLISGISLAGYAALRIVGNRHGATLLGLLGGMVSSTATTMIFARHAKNDAALRPTAVVVILLANLVVLLRLTLLTSFLAPPLLLPLALIFGCALLAGAALVFYRWWQLVSGSEIPVPSVSNPTEMKVAFAFGAMYAVVLVLSAALQDMAGNGGLYAIAAASGLTDVDAISLSTLRMFNQDILAMPVALIAISLAVLTNLAFKAAISLSIGGRELFRAIAPGFASIAAGLLVGLWLVL